MHRLADGLACYDALHSLVARLSSFDGTRQIAASGSDLLRELQRQKDSIARLEHALAEAAEICNMLGNLPTAVPPPADLLVELTSLRAESLDLRDQLSGIYERMPSSATPILLLGMLIIIVTA